MDDFFSRLKEKNLSLFFDFDGTLAAITAHPEKASLSYATKNVIRGLADMFPLAIVSGRGMDDLKEKVGLDNVVYCANHGFEISGKGHSFTHDTGGVTREALHNLMPEVSLLSKKFPGVIAEDKGVTASVHYRLLDARSTGDFITELHALLAPFLERGDIRLTEGKKVFELRPPVEWHKGSAVLWLLKREPFADTYPLYLGDDRTDKDAFRAVKNIGVSVHIGGFDDEADYFLSQQSDVYAFLVDFKDKYSAGR